MRSPKGYRTLLVRQLRELIEERRTSVTAVERALGRGRGYLGDALRGEKKLTLEVLLEVLVHLEIEPAAFFAEVDEARTAPGGLEKGYEEPLGHSAGVVAEGTASGDLLRHIERGLDSANPPNVRDVATLLHRLVTVLEAKGMIHRQELDTSRSRDPFPGAGGPGRR